MAGDASAASSAARIGAYTENVDTFFRIWRRIACPGLSLSARSCSPVSLRPPTRRCARVRSVSRLKSRFFQSPRGNSGLIPRFCLSSLRHRATKRCACGLPTAFIIRGRILRRSFGRRRIPPTVIANASHQDANARSLACVPGPDPCLCER